MIKIDNQWPVTTLKICVRERAERLRDEGVYGAVTSAAILLLSNQKAPFGEWVVPTTLWSCGFEVEHDGQRWSIPFCFIDM